MKKFLILFGLFAIIAIIPVFAYPLCHGGYGCYPPPPPHHKMHRPHHNYGGIILGRRWNMGNRAYFNSNVGYYNGIPWYSGNRGVFNSAVSVKF